MKGYSNLTDDAISDLIHSSPSPYGVNTLKQYKDLKFFLSSQTPETSQCNHSKCRTCTHINPSTTVTNNKSSWTWMRIRPTHLPEKCIALAAKCVLCYTFEKHHESAIPVLVSTSTTWKRSYTSKNLARTTLALLFSTFQLYRPYHQRYDNQWALRCTHELYKARKLLEKHIILNLATFILMGLKSARKQNHYSCQWIACWIINISI